MNDLDRFDGEGENRILLTPSPNGELCLGNGQHEEIEIRCDECSFFLECFPDTLDTSNKDVVAELQKKADKLLQDGMKLANESEENKQMILKIWGAMRNYFQMCIEHYEQGKEFDIKLSDIINSCLDDN